jgi:cytoskeletal protein CcmA (bactofilin family)
LKKKINTLYLNGGALSLVVGISLVIAIFLGSLLLIFYYSQIVIDDNRIEIDLIDNINSTHIYIQAHPNLFTDKKCTLLDLYKNGSDSIRVDYEKWGAYDLFTVTAFRGMHQKSKSAFWGEVQSDLIALYLPNSGEELSLLGKSTILGKSFVPNGKISSGSLGRKIFTGSLPHESSILPSSDNLPEIDGTLIESIRKIVSKTTGDPVLPETSFVNSFQAPVKEFFLEGPVILNNDLKGNILVKSTHSIEVTINSSLEDVILIAPKIIIRDFVKGSFQAIASDTIEIQTGVKLNYPSLLMVLNSTKGLISLKSASFSGTIIMYKDNSDLSNLFIMDSGSKIEGTLFNDGYSNLQGHISGSVYSNKILMNQFGEIRSNNLLDAIIDSQSLNPNFVRPAIFGYRGNSKIIEFIL